MRGEWLESGGENRHSDVFAMKLFLDVDQGSQVPAAWKRRPLFEAQTKCGAGSKLG